MGPWENLENVARQALSGQIASQATVRAAFQAVAPQADFRSQRKRLGSLELETRQAILKLGVDPRTKSALTEDTLLSALEWHWLKHLCQGPWLTGGPEAYLSDARRCIATPDRAAVIAPFDMLVVTLVSKVLGSGKGCFVSLDVEHRCVKTCYPVVDPDVVDLAKNALSGETAAMLLPFVHSEVIP